MSEAHPPIWNCATCALSYGKVEALHGISVHVEQGEIVTILGANGAGENHHAHDHHAGPGNRAEEASFFRAGPCTPDRAMKSCGLGITQSPEGRRVFVILSVRENLDLGAFTSKDRAVPPRYGNGYSTSSPASRNRERAACRNPLRRRTADARHRPRAHGRPQGAAPRRAVPRPCAAAGALDLRTPCARSTARA